ncbi:uncharacterized protein TEOVI_000134500 [Trypanosoma equiperdum]|uniref:Uncharacterized protein n=1 Tax=Trypanosoma equiperdum TaxID=5694 RepID=A0A1G4ICL6_TRYEQ|nr:hypothetical protein, conserved [Trypanosoma equiperdum]
MEERDEITATSFRVVVLEERPYSFEECAAQQVRSSVRVTHIAFTPPTVEEVESYVKRQQQTRKQKLSSRVKTYGDAALRQLTLANLTTLCASGKMESHTVACFPWGFPGNCGTVAGPLNLESEGSSKRTIGADNLFQLEQVRLGGVYTVVLPRMSDLCSNVDIRFDVDGFVQLEVVGPGSVTFFGEQYSSLIPEWLNHHFFNVEDGEEHEEDSDEDDIAQMYRLIR